MNAKILVIHYNSSDVIATSVCQAAAWHFYVETPGAEVQPGVYSATGMLYKEYTPADLGHATLGTPLLDQTKDNIAGVPIADSYYYYGSDYLYHLCTSQDHHGL